MLAPAAPRVNRCRRSTSKAHRTSSRSWPRTSLATPPLAACRCARRGHGRGTRRGGGLHRLTLAAWLPRRCRCLLQADFIKWCQAPAAIGITSDLLASLQHGVSADAFWRHLYELGGVQQLARIALMLLAISPSSASSERVYSAAGRLWEAERSRLTSERVRKLLFVYFNRRALLRRGAQC